MTLADKIEIILGEDKFIRIKEHRIADTFLEILGKDNFLRLKEFLGRNLKDNNFSNQMISNASKKAYGVLKEIGNETPYGFFTDAVAQNLTSLVYVLNDRYVAGQSWPAVIGTRINAAIGNTITGRPYGAWQDYVIAKADYFLGISKDSNRHRKFLKGWAAKTGAFATGQSWLYALFLASGNAIAGEQTDFEKIGAGVATLTLLAPLLGPYSDKIYQKIRVQFGLEAIPDYRPK